MHLKDIRFIDMKRSKIDKEKSDPAKDRYVFEKGGKVYTKYPKATDKWKLKWGRLTPSGHEIEEWRNWYHAEFVIPSDGIWPEGLTHNENGQYQYGDAVLMKIPVEEYLKKRKDEMDRANIAPRLKVQEFEKKTPTALKQEELRDILGH